MRAWRPESGRLHGGNKFFLETSRGHSIVGMLLLKVRNVPFLSPQFLIFNLFKIFLTWIMHQYT